jgi:hypothetical protein
VGEPLLGTTLTWKRNERARTSATEARKPVHREYGCAKGQLSYSNLRRVGPVTDWIQEFASLDDDAKIYKLVGPVLLKQDTSEAKSTVNSRLEYIEKEM